MFDFLRMPGEPVSIGAIEIGPSTTPRQLVVRAMLSVKRLALPAAALMAVQQASQAAVPIVMGLAIDRAIDAGGVSRLLRWLVVLAGLYAVLAVTYRLAYRLEILAMQLVCYHMRMRVARAVLEPRRALREQPGVGLSVFTQDVNRLGLAPGLLVYPFGNLVAISVVAVALFLIAWPIGVVVVAGTPLMLWLLARVGQPLQRRTFQQSERMGDATETAADLLAGLRVIKGLGAEAEAARRYTGRSQEVLAATLTMKSSQAAYQVVTNLISGLFLAVVAVLIGWLALGGDLSVGELVTAVGLAAFAAAPVQSLTREVAPQWAVAIAAAGRVLNTLRAPLRPRGDPAPLDGFAVPLVELRSVTIGAGRPIDLVVEPGEFVGIVTDGTIAQRLEEAFGLRRPVDAGAILLGGHDIAAVDEHAVRRVVLAAPHAADLFDGTVAQNVEPLSAEGPSPTARAAADAAACGDIIASLTDGWDTRVGEGGTRLSGGQRQRIALARAVAARAPVLVLHEPTTSVDSVTEALIADRLRAARAGGTTIVISTSPALLAAADRVVWTSDGEVRYGRHVEMLADPAYAEVVA